MHLHLQISPESGEVVDAWSGSGVGWWRQAGLLTAKLSSGAGWEGVVTRLPQSAGEVAHSIPPEGAIC